MPRASAIIAITMVLLVGLALPVHAVDPPDQPTLGIDITPESMDFGTLNIYDTLSSTVTLTNNGNADLEVSGVGLVDIPELPYLITEENCSDAVLGNGDSCSVTVEFAPNAIAEYSDSFDIAFYNPDVEDLSISLTGSAQEVAGNVAPDVPMLIYPEDGTIDVPVSFSFTWGECDDLNDDVVTYEVYLGTDKSFVDVVPIIVELETDDTTAMNLGNSYASLSLMLAGLALAGGLSRRRRLVLLIVVAVMTMMLLVSCAPEETLEEVTDTTDTDTVDTTPIVQIVEIAYVVAGLEPATTYYWKVIAKDTSGGVSESEVRSFTTE